MLKDKLKVGAGVPPARRPLAWARATALLAAGCGMTLASLPSLAADVAPGEQLEEIVITGSRIATPELQSFVPVAVVSNQAIEASGQLNISEMLRDMPSVGTSVLSGSNSNFLVSNSGINTINLRNLGDQRTLVLVNGRRMTPGVAGSSEVDFNSIPTDFIDHIEVVTGGASAIYGSDAIAGAVNVIYKSHFNGLQFRAQAGQTGYNDDSKFGGAVLAGSDLADGRGHFMLDVSYDQDDGLRSAQRTRSTIDQQISATTGHLLKPAYSSYVPAGYFTYDSVNGDSTTPGQFTFNPDGTLLNGSSLPANERFNRNAWRRITVPISRTLIASTLDWDLTEKQKAYAEFTYGQNHTKSAIEPLPLSSCCIGPNGVYDPSGSGVVDPVTGDVLGVPVSNAYLQTLPILAPVASAINTWNAANPADLINFFQFRRRLSDVAPRTNTADRQTYRVVFGVKGDVSFLNDWTYDASWTFGKTTDNQISTGSVSLPNMRAALDSIVVGGKIVCRDPVAQAEGCVPINIFGVGSITPAMAAWVNSNTTRNAAIQEQVLSAFATGPVFQLPAGPLEFVIGAEVRKDSSKEIWDTLTNLGQNGSNSLPNVYGSIDVKEAYAEANAPLLKDTPFAKSLSAEGAFRRAHYSTAGDVDAWKLGLNWAPIDSVRLRGVYSVAVRAPNIGELYGGQSQTFPTGITDPCDGVTATSVNHGYDAQCRAIAAIAHAIATAPTTGPNAGQFFYNLPLDYQVINGFVGSNPQLKQETATTKTLGIVLTPEALHGFVATVDYFNVTVRKAVSVVDFQTSINQCLATGDNAFCSAVVRNPVSGKLQVLYQISENVGSVHTSGVDTTLRYHWGLDGTWIGGGLDLSLSETHLLSLEQQSLPSQPFTDNLGELNSGANGRLGSGFRDRANLTATYTKGPLEASWKINYLGQIYDTLPNDYNAGAFGPYWLNHVPAYYYHDVQVAYTFGNKSKVKAYVGANNLFNKQPPYLPSGMASENTGTETAADTYDAIGIYVYAGVKVTL